MISASLFAPFADLAEALFPHAIPNASDGAHDIAHITRVWVNVKQISAIEGGDLETLLPATLLHDCISVEKDSPDRKRTSALAAQHARDILQPQGWANARLDAICHAIEAHSFSANIETKTQEARILQDADRLDAIGFIGIARCFYVAGRMGSTLYDPNDPHAETRALNDAKYAIDHFETKLLTLANGFKTREGQRLAQARHQELLTFREAFLKQVGA